MVDQNLIIELDAEGQGLADELAAMFDARAVDPAVPSVPAGQHTRVPVGAGAADAVGI